jgi:bifunctional non-homologous end joining protein LigD
MTRKSSDEEEAWEAEADGHTVRITHSDKVIYPEIGATKRDVARYYLAVADRLMPAVKGRPLVLRRFPDGVNAPGFFQKRVPEKRPEWVRTAVLPSPTNEGPIEYVVADNLATVLWAANLGSVEVNPWLALAERPENPTDLVADLDPMGGPFRDVCRAALLVREAFSRHGLEGAAKTSGKTGIHVFAPAPAGITYPEARERLKAIGYELDRQHPEVFALEERIKEREGQIYFDYNQNGYGSTIAAAWSLRAAPRATVSMPLTWEEMEACPEPEQFTLRSVLASLPDP